MSRHIAYLSLGSNLCNPDVVAGLRHDRLSCNIDNALRALGERGVTLLKCSSFFETEPWGFDSPNGFINAAVKVETGLSPLDLLQTLCEVERQMGRTEKSNSGQYSDRIIDIDILFYDNVVMSLPSLIIPHPLMEQRRFVLAPLAEIAPDFVHPLLKKKIAALLEKLDCKSL